MRAIRSVVLATLSGLALVGFVASAGAVIVAPSGDIVTVTFTGTIGSGAQDLDGTFGCTACTSDDNPYEGDTLTLVYTFDTGVGYTSDTDPSLYAKGGTSYPADEIFGTPEMPAPPPSPLVGNATATINGVTIDLGGGFQASLENDAFSGSSAPYTLTAEVSDANGDEFQGTVTSSDIPFSITTPFGPTDFGENVGTATVEYNCASPGSCAAFIVGDLTVSLTNASLTVPEPSTWLMMAGRFCRPRLCRVLPAKDSLRRVIEHG
jgi:hypothetical protein